MSDEVFSIPKGPVGPWDKLSPNEKAWLELFLVITCGSEPAPTTSQIRDLTNLFSNETASKEER